MQATVCFVVWVGLGVLLATRKARLPRFVAGNRWGGAVCLVGACAVMVGGLALVAMTGGLRNGSLAPWAWLACILLGAVFVLLQSWGALGLANRFLRAETTPPGQASLATKEQE